MAPTGTGRRPLSLGLIAWLSVLTLGITGAVYLQSNDDSAEVWVADVALPAFHQITSDDLQLRRIDRSNDDPQFFTTAEKDSLVGAYTLTRVEQGSPLEASVLGPRLPPNSMDGLAVALDYSAETTLAGRLSRGDVADLYILDSSKETRVVAGVLVLDIESKGTPAVVIDVAEGEIDTAVEAVGTQIVLVRTRPYSEP